MNPIGWAEAAADIIVRDDDMEEPPTYTSGHEAFIKVWCEYDGREPEEEDE